MKYMNCVRCGLLRSSLRTDGTCGECTRGVEHEPPDKKPLLPAEEDASRWPGPEYVWMPWVGPRGRWVATQGLLLFEAREDDQERLQRVLRNAEKYVPGAEWLPQLLDECERLQHECEALRGENARHLTGHYRPEDEQCLRNWWPKLFKAGQSWIVDPLDRTNFLLHVVDDLREELNKHRAAGSVKEHIAGIERHLQSESFRLCSDLDTVSKRNSQLADECGKLAQQLKDKRAECDELRDRVRMLEAKAVKK